MPKLRDRAERSGASLLTRRIAFALLLAACPSSHAAWTVGFTAVGSIRIGMTLRQVNRVLGEHLKADAVPGADPTGSCFQAGLQKSSGVELMFIADKLVRIDIHRAGLRTSNGVGVGDPESAVLAAYRERLTRSAHAYIDGGWYLTSRDGHGAHAIRFEIQNGRVADFYVGSAAAVAFTEGCA